MDLILSIYSKKLRVPFIFKFAFNYFKYKNFKRNLGI